jgi:hypothetical protein
MVNSYAENGINRAGQSGIIASWLRGDRTAW